MPAELSEVEYQVAKPTLYALLTKRSVIDVAQGDSINELRTLAIFSSVFDVYYNNEKFSEGKTRIGDPDRLGPDRQYDFYYIRNNPDVFCGIIGTRLSFAYPYNKTIFEQSDALIVLTENWKEHLLGKHPDSTQKLRTVYEDVCPEVQCPVISVGQTLDITLSNFVPSERDLFEMKARTTGAAIFGYYGNLSADLYPYTAFAALERLAMDYPPNSVMIVLAGRFRKGGEIRGPNLIHIGSIPYSKMPALHDNTVANLTNESPLNNCLGNQKVIDSLSRGIPIMCKRLDTFVWQLGDDYPCFYETEQEAYDIAKQLIFDDDFRTHVQRLSLNRSQFFSLENVRRRFVEQEELKALLPNRHRSLTYLAL